MKLPFVKLSHSGSSSFRHRVPTPQSLTAKAAASISALCLLASPVFSAIVYWDGDGTGMVGGGAGTWDTTLAHWSTTPDGSTYQAWNNANNDDAVFSTTGGTVAITSAITVNSLTFTSGGYTLSGATQTLTSTSGTLTMDSQTGINIVNALYSSSMTMIVKNGGGLLSTGTPQTAFTGKWVVNGGILSIPNDNRLGPIPSAIVPDYMTLDGGSLRSSTGSVTFNANRGMTLGPNGGGFDSINTSIMWAGPITGISGGSLTKRGSFNLILNNNTNNYDGNTLVSAGRLTVAAPNALGNAIGNTQVSAGAGLVFDGAATNFAIAEPIQISGVGVGTDGGAIAVLNGANVTFTGPVTLAADSTVTVAPTATAIYSNANAFTSADLSLTLQGDTVTTGGGGMITGGISLGAGNLTKAQTGKWTLAGLSVYAGLTSVSEGTLIIAGSINGTSQVDVTGTLGGSGTITVGNGGSVSVLAGGKLSPGSSPGTLSVTLSGGGAFNISGGVNAPNSQSLIFELGAPGASDKVALTGGPLSIGTSVLEFDDFVLSTLAGFFPTDYVLFDASIPILGTLGANRIGTVGGFLAELQLADGGNDLILHIVPEPSAALALVVGSVTLVGVRRRRPV
jgi:fibronectin-binding autotransporter adhesin